jgi:hypothetical protein
MNTHAVYHWWGFDGEPPVWANLRTPVVLSIATLRAVSDIPIIVLDISDTPTDWGDLPDRLGFRVRHVEPALRAYQDCVRGWRHLSRLFDMRCHLPGIIPEGDIALYVDSDVFWFRDPLPLDRDPGRMCMDGWNTGLFYYRTGAAGRFWDLFEPYAKAAIHSEDVRSLFKRHVSYDSWYGVWDEMIVGYMREKHPDAFNFIDNNEHATARNIGSANLATVKMFHCNGTVVHNQFHRPGGQHDHSRGLMCLLAKEFYEGAASVLGDEGLRAAFTREEMDFYLPKQVPLLAKATLINALCRVRSGFDMRWVNDRLPIFV